MKLREAFQTKKLIIFLKRNVPLKILRNKLKNIGTQSINMSDIIVYLAMFNKTVDKILCFLGSHKVQMSHYFSVTDTLGLF